MPPWVHWRDQKPAAGTACTAGRGAFSSPSVPAGEGFRAADLRGPYFTLALPGSAAPEKKKRRQRAPAARRRRTSGGLILHRRRLRRPQDPLRVGAHSGSYAPGEYLPPWSRPRRKGTCPMPAQTAQGRPWRPARPLRRLLRAWYTGEGWGLTAVGPAKMYYAAAQAPRRARRRSRKRRAPPTTAAPERRDRRSAAQRRLLVDA